MRHFRLAVVVLGVIWATACSSSNTNTTPQSPRGTEALPFSVSTEKGSGTFNPVLDVKSSGNTTTVTITALQATDLSAAYAHLHYDASKYTPSTVEFGSFLGSKDEVVTLALTDISGDVPVGVAQVPSTGVLPKNGTGAIATVTFTTTPFTGGRTTSKAPEGGKNAVTDLEIVTDNGSSVELHWTEKNKGDYDNNGLVTISDLTPLGIFLGQTVANAADPVQAGMIDGDDNGEINVADLTTIGANFGNQLSGYTLYSDANGTVKLVDIPRPTTGYDVKHPIEYLYDCAASGGEHFVVRPDGASSDETGPVSNEAEVVVVPGPPDPPSNLQAVVGANIGNLKVRLNWTASPSADVKGYNVERKLHSDPDSSFTDIVGAPINSTSYTDQTGLTDADYDYRIRAEDKEQPAEYSTYTTPNVTAHPYVQVISPPINVTAQPAAGAPSSITVDWDGPADNSGERFTVYRKGPGDSSFTAIATTLNNVVTDYTDPGLTESQDYQYYVTSRDAFLTAESVPSATVTSQCSAATILAVTLTTDKTTHLFSGTEPASNLTAGSNIPGTAFTWSTDLNPVTGSGANVTWKPSGASGAKVVTITVTGTFGAQQAQATQKMYLTTETIKTQFGNSGHYLDDINKGGSTPSIPSVLAPTQPYRPLSFYCTQDHVVLYDAWGIWCHWCRSEFPNVKHMWDYYNPGGFMYVGEDDSGESVSQVTNYFGAPHSNGGWDSWNPQHAEITDLNGWESYEGTDPAWSSSYGLGGYPTAILIDRDGNIRWQGVGAELSFDSTTPQDFCSLLSELTGKSPVLTYTWDHYQ